MYLIVTGETPVQPSSFPYVRERENLKAEAPSEAQIKERQPEQKLYMCKAQQLVLMIVIMEASYFHHSRFKAISLTHTPF